MLRYPYQSIEFSFRSKPPPPFRKGIAKADINQGKDGYSPNPVSRAIEEQHTCVKPASRNHKFWHRIALPRFRRTSWKILSVDSITPICTYTNKSFSHRCMPMTMHLGSSISHLAFRLSVSILIFEENRKGEKISRKRKNQLFTFVSKHRHFASQGRKKSHRPLEIPTLWSRCGWESISRLHACHLFARPWVFCVPCLWLWRC